jgi:ABC-2 type transport system permease protein
VGGGGEVNKILLIASNTYRLRIRSGAFLFLTFALPIIMVAIGVISAISERDRASLETMGYIDQTNQLADVTSIETEGITLALVKLETEELAQEAYINGKVDGYLLIPGGFFEGEPVTFYGEESPGSTLWMGIRLFMRQALFPNVSDDVLERVENPSQVTHVSLATGTEISSEVGLVVYFAAPAVVAIMFALAVSFMTGQLGSAVVREKEMRVMEIVITSLRPVELVGGKVLGMSLLALTQFGIWTVGAMIAVLLFMSGELDLQSLVIPWSSVLWGVLLIVPGYLLFAVLGAGAGVIAGDSQQAQQVAGMAGLFVFMPMWFLPTLIERPNNSFALAMTLFPLTSPMVVLMRMTVSDVPIWQLVASLTLLVVSVVVAIWAFARIFRAAMLVYGQTLRPRQIWAVLRQS